MRARQKVILKSPTTSIPASVTLREIDGGPNYYARNGFTYAVQRGWDNPYHFMIGNFFAGVEDQSKVNIYLELGWNTLVHSYNTTNVALCRTNNISIVHETTESLAIGSETVGLALQDEPPDYSPLASIIGGTANSVQDGRFWYLNNTWNFIAFGGLSPYSQAETLYHTVMTPNGTFRHVDIQSMDEYFFNGSKPGFDSPYRQGILLGLGRDATVDESTRGCRYGDMVDEMRSFQVGHFPSPVWMYVETSGAYTQDNIWNYCIWPAELDASVWGCILHGARGVIYFDYYFGSSSFSGGPSRVNDIIVADPSSRTIQPGQSISIYNQIKATDALVHKMAPVINSPTAIGYATVSPAASTLAGFDMMCKYSGGKFYIFAMPRYSKDSLNQTATFTIKNTGAIRATLVNEATARSVSITNRGTQFTDTFATGHTVHIYRID